MNSSHLHYQVLYWTCPAILITSQCILGNQGNTDPSVQLSKFNREEIMMLRRVSFVNTMLHLTDRCSSINPLLTSEYILYAKAHVFRKFHKLWNSRKTRPSLSAKPSSGLRSHTSNVSLLRDTSNAQINIYTAILGLTSKYFAPCYIIEWLLERNSSCLLCGREEKRMPLKYIGQDMLRTYEDWGTYTDARFKTLFHDQMSHGDQCTVHDALDCLNG